MKTENQKSAARLEVVGTLSAADLKILKGPFPKDRLGVKVQSFNKERTRAMLVLYLQHTDVQDRLEEVDPAWTSEVMGEERDGDTVYVRIRLTLKGVARENVGEGGDPKSAFSDALKRAAMLFGIGRYLYDSPTVWTEFNDQRDRFRSWSVDDYDRALKSSGKGTHAPVAPAASETGAASAPSASASSVKVTPAEKSEKPGLKTVKSGKSASGRTREQLNRVLMNLYRPYLTRYPETRFADLLKERYQVGETRLMAIEQMEDLAQFMEAKLASAPQSEARASS